MTGFGFGRYTLGVCVAITILAGCGGGSNGLSSSVAPSLAVPGTGLPQALRSQPDLGRYASHGVRQKSTTFTVLYSFAGGGAACTENCDGAYPEASLLDVNGTLYGTTFLGGGQGGYGQCASGAGCGTVFATTPSGSETILHRFIGDVGSYRDGAEPTASVINRGAQLYGTTTAGGAYSEGTVFKITPSRGRYAVLYSFGATAEDGLSPYAGLTKVAGTFYGTTVQGGAYGEGTVFKITPSGTETVLHSFGGTSEDPGFPFGGLHEFKGMLYGTTRGTTGYCYSPSGSVFAISTSGTETVLHRFGFGSGDGDCPNGSLIALSGKLYGTTEYGGSYSTNCSHGCGTVFRMTPSGAETVIHSFGAGCPSACTDGTDPGAGLINVNGTLYSTTYTGGTYSINWGTVFSITPSGTETVLHNFGQNEGLGGYPDGGLINVNGTLYGTASNGGANQCNCGIVFSLSP